MTYANSDKGAQMLYLNKSIKENVSIACTVSLSRVNSAITEFVKADYLKRINTASYQVNPFLFGKGDWRDIKNIRAKFDYGNGKVVAEFEQTLKSAELTKQAQDKRKRKNQEEANNVDIQVKSV